jgi:hypothetical protein
VSFVLFDVMGPKTFAPPLSNFDTAPHAQLTGHDLFYLHTYIDHCGSHCVSGTCIRGVPNCGPVQTVCLYLASRLRMVSMTRTDRVVVAATLWK